MSALSKKHHCVKCRGWCSERDMYRLKGPGRKWICIGCTLALSVKQDAETLITEELEASSEILNRVIKEAW